MSVPTSKVQFHLLHPLISKIKSKSKSLFSTSSSSSSSSMAPPQSQPTDPSSFRLVYIGDPDRTHLESVPVPAGNSISTTKYNVLTFIPRNLYEQFRRVAYIYFFLLACLNQVPVFNMVGGAVPFIPLGIVLVATACKDGYEDYQRHKSDKDQNNRFATVLDPHTRTFVRKKWNEIRVGEIVKIGKNETIPCDLVLLSSSDPSGAAYVQTINLDGESNLKTRYALHQFVGCAPEYWLADAGLIRCEGPNLNIHGFQASIVVEDCGVISLGPKNVVLRGCEVKNTEWAFGVAVYAGMETKVMLNNSGAPSKRSRLETQMNREIIALAVGMILMCLVLTTLTGIWLKHKQEWLDIIPYYRRKDYSSGTPKNYKYEGIGLEMLIAFGKAVFLFQNFIPLLLYFSLEFARLTQTVLMSRDRSMYHEATDTKLQCRALNINEDLGQIKYIFSDKTGTLTENKMVFQCASVCGVDYSHGQGPIPGEVAPHPIVVDGQVWRPKVAVNTDPKLVRLLEYGKGTEEQHHAYSFFLALSLCNTIVPQVAETSDPAVKLIDYQGESPDEQALIYAAAAYGFVLIERTSGHIMVDVLGDRQRFEILGIHEFDSDRKRMSVIVSCPDKSTKLFVKGADNSMFSVMDKSSNDCIIHATETHLHSYSSMGLRTLVIGMRELTSTDFKDWLLAYEEASTSLSGRNDLLKAVAVKVECDLHILGASGIEDKLQQGVPEAIESLRQAGIKVWVLTGDKQETAISIGYSCKLLTDDMTQIIINSHSKEDAKKSLTDAIAMTKKLVSTHNNDEGRKHCRVPIALIIDGPSLVHILKTDLEEELFVVAIVCDAVLCCRVAPLQKAGIVSLVKKRTRDITLSIGDGANDVSMIQMADVGIGISGQEGRQAVMASDFAMGQFRFLVPLLLVHGHWNYQRISYLILYNIYKGSILVFIDYWYIYISEFSLSNPVSDELMILYAVCTGFPNIFVGIYDQDLSRKTLLKYPEYYGVGPREESYSLKLFGLTMMDSLWQSLTVFCVTYFAYVRSSLDYPSLGDTWIISVVLLTNLHLAMDVIRWNLKLHVALWGTIIITFLAILGLDQVPGMTGYRAFNHLLSTGAFWLTILSVVAIALLPRFTCKVFKDYLFPNDVRIGREMEKLEKDVAVAEDKMDSSTNSEVSRK